MYFKRREDGVTMIELVYLSYAENLELDRMITAYANENLEEMIHYAWDCLEMDKSNIEFFAPLRILARSQDECFTYIKELWGFTQEPILRTSLTPVYQFFLYQIIKWYVDDFSETENGRIPVDEPIIINAMDDNLKKKTVKKYGVSAVERFTDVKSYLEEFFYDWDFMPDFLAGAVQLCWDDPRLFQCLISTEELESYTDLMDGDTYRKYQTLCIQERLQSSGQEHRQLAFHADIKKALLSIQRNSQYWNLAENSLNDVLRDLLRMNYIVEDQSRQGISQSGKEAGEVDFLVSYDKEPVAIMEALKLSTLNRAYIESHIDKLLVNYNPLGCPNACLILYVACKDFFGFWEQFVEYIANYTFPFSIEKEFKEADSGYTESRSAYILLCRSGKPILLSFYAIHMQEKK